MAPASPRSIVHVLWSGNVGGIERCVHDLAIEQARTGADVSVAFGRREGPFAEALDRAHVDTVDLQLQSGYHSHLPKLGRNRSTLARADIVHLHNFNLPLGVLVARCEVPVVFTEHGNFHLGRKLGATGATKRYLQRHFLRRYVPIVVANSVHTSRRLTHIYALSPNRVRVIHNGIRPPNPQNIRREEPESPIRLAYIGRFVQFKRIDRLLQAVAALRSPSAVRILLIGDGPLGSDLRALAAELGLTDIVHFLGLRQDLDTLLPNIDVLVQPSENEPFGLTILEAYSRGALPIVFADGGGALETLPPDGLVATDPADLARILERLPGSPALTHRARQQRAAFARDRFSIERTAEAYGNLYTCLTSL